MITQEIQNQFDKIQQQLTIICAIADLLGSINETPLDEETLPCIGSFLTEKLHESIKSLERLRSDLHTIPEGEHP